MVAVRTQDLTEVTVDGELVALRLLADRRDELAGARTRTVSRLHRLLLELIPAGAPRFLSAAQAKALLATVRPRDVAGRTRRQLAAELLADIVVLDRKLKDSDKRLSEAVAAAGTGLLDLRIYRIAEGRPRASPPCPATPSLSCVKSGSARAGHLADVLLATLQPRWGGNPMAMLLGLP